MRDICILFATLMSLMNIASTIIIAPTLKKRFSQFDIRNIAQFIRQRAIDFLWRRCSDTLNSHVAAEFGLENDVSR